MTATLRLKFWLNMALVISTSYIIVWYIFTPSNNHCQMTFMMEPPRFIPVPVDKSDGGGGLSYPEIKKRPNDHKDLQYKLYMYSEFGFPQPSDVHRDLKDSMPVLFVPGNAGSYQQVRSLASTCIRRQLQSLEAFKFVFYTIDFGGQLSGLDGGLIKDQITYVRQCLNQITKMHPHETDGVILIGHSVGGFISKALLTVPSFDFDSVPLLISLASPLTMPYLIFDDQMRELYEITNRIWDVESKHNKTIALSISGGITDHLVPMHSSMDPQYDLSLTTSAIKDVWLATDHVCITWCRELMQKLAQLLSALMDRKQTRLISNKESALGIMKDILLDHKVNGGSNTNVIYKDWRTIRSHVIEDFEDFYSVSRLQLIDNIIVLNMTNNHAKDVLILIHHLDNLKEDAIFGCPSVNSTSTQLNCIKRSGKMNNLVSIPSRRYEPKRKALRLNRASGDLINYLILDFNDHSSNPLQRLGNKVPESLTVQVLDEFMDQELYIPSLFEFVFKKLFFMDSYKRKIIHKKLPSVYIKIKLLNLKHKTQTYSIKYQSIDCELTDANANSPTLMITQDGYLSESFHPTIVDKDESVVIVKLKSQKSVKIKEPNVSELNQVDQTHLELYVDGRCRNYLVIQMDVLDLVVICIQNSLSKILSATTYLAYLSLVSSAYVSLVNQQVGSSSHTSELVWKSFGYILISLKPVSLISVPTIFSIPTEEISDEVVTFLLIFALSVGVLAYLEYFVKRAIDVAYILNNAQTLIRTKLLQSGLFANKPSASSSNGTGAEATHSKSLRVLAADLDWILLGLAIAGSFVFSTALITLFTILILVKLDLNFGYFRSHQDKNRNEEDSKSSPGKQNTKINCEGSFHMKIHDLIVSITVLSVLSLISNIPSTLIQIKGNQINSPAAILGRVQKDHSFIAATVSALLVKLISEKIYSEYSRPSGQLSKHSRCTGNWLTCLISNPMTRYLHLVTLIPIMLIEMNISYMNLSLAISLLWLTSVAHRH